MTALANPSCGQPDKKDILATKDDLSQTKIDLIKWMVGFWLTQMAVLVGLYMRP